VTLDRAATVELVASGDGETVEFAAPHPASATATATPHPTTLRTRDLHGEYFAVVGGDIAAR
jgi:hypothetical protein